MIRVPLFLFSPFFIPHDGTRSIQKVDCRPGKGTKDGEGQPDGSMKIDEIREGNTHQNKEGPKDVDEGLPQSETPLNLPQFVRKENDEEDQRDQYERKDDEVEKVKIHHSHSRRADPGLMASVLHSTGNKVNPSTPRPEGLGLLRVDPERCFFSPP